MRGRNIVIVAFQPWNYGIGSNAKDIALEFAKHNKVLYVNSPLDRISYLRDGKNGSVQEYLDVISQKQPGLVQIEANIWNLYPDFIAESINWIRINSLYDFFNRRNTKRFCDGILKACDELGFRDIVLFNDNLIFKGVFIKEFLSPSLYIYYLRDFLNSQKYFKRHGERIEKELMRVADVVVANSLYLRDYASEFNEKSYYVGQGCDLSLFDPEKVGEVPDDFKEIRRPVIGYLGSLTAMRLDITLIATLARANNSWSVVLVGPEDEEFQKSELHRLSNVHFLGKKESHELAACIAGFDVCINPQLINLLTIGNYPRKIDEYLAMGKPVVATRTKAMEIFEPHCYLAANSNEYIDYIHKALAENTDAKKKDRIRFARSHSWQNSVGEIYRSVELIKGK